MATCWQSCCFRQMTHSGVVADVHTDSEDISLNEEDFNGDDLGSTVHIEGPTLALGRNHGNTLILPDKKHKDGSKTQGEVTFSSDKNSPKMDSSESGYESSAGHRDKSEITPMHAAAVNGDKSALAKLIYSNRVELDSGDKFGRTPLMYCILGDRVECAEMLIKANADINKKDIGGRTAMHWAAHKGNFKCLKLLLNKGANCKIKDNEGQSPMHLSTRHSSPKCLALLMKQLEPGEVDDQDKNKRTALHWASSYGILEHVRMLIKQDSNIGIPDVEGKTPLHWAASSKGDHAVDCVKLILETAPSVINWQDFEGRTALHLAVADGNEAVVDALRSLEKCNVSALDNMFRTPLHWSAVLGHSRITEMLLDSHADYTSSDSNGATPLHYASQNNHDDTVRIFLEHKGLRDEPDIEGRTAFIWAAGKGADKVIKTFIQHKVDMSLADKTGGTALHASALAGHSLTVKYLLENNAQINMTDLQKYTPLFRACEMGHMNVVQTLIEHGARVDTLDQDGRSPLHWAALGGHAYICQTLIKYGIEPNIRDNNGRSPLQCAAYGGFVNCMSVLIEHKADPNAQDKEGMTALHWACSKGHADAVRLLIEFNAFPNHMEFTEDRYTPLDYALMGEHYEVAQYMIEQGALSITGIQDIAALKIQSVFRGFRVRKTFMERKRLLMKHEQLRKDAAKKKAEEEYKRKEDVKHKHEVAERLLCKEGDSVKESDLSAVETGTEATQSVSGSAVISKPSMHSTTQVSEEQTTHNAPVPSVPPATVTPASVMPAATTYRMRKKVPVISEEEIIMKKKRANQRIVKDERHRLKEFRRKDWAARIIQKAWRSYNFHNKGIWKTAKETIREKRLLAGEEEWFKQIAALTIQLAWRKYYRKKLLRSLTPKNQRILRMWDPSVIAAKQRAMVEQIYGESSAISSWYPKRQTADRPTWFKLIPSPAAVSFNFAMGQYFPRSNSARKFRHSWANYEYMDITDDFGKMKIADSFQPHNFSYNMYEY